MPDHAVLSRTNLLTPLQEQYTREVKLPAEEEFLIRRLLRHCYLTGYRDEPYTDENDPPPQMKAPAYVNRLHLNAQMYAIADKYDIPSLKEVAVGKFDAAILEMKDNQNMERHTGASLFDEMTEAIPCIYSSTPEKDRRLRDRAVDVMHGKFRKHLGLKRVIAEVPEFFWEPGLRSRPRLPIIIRDPWSDLARYIL